MSEKLNYGGVANPDQIINQIVSFSGLFEKIFGKLLPPLVYNRDMEHSVHVLQEIYGYKDARKLFPRVLDRDAFGKLSKVVFRIIETNNQNQW